MSLRYPARRMYWRTSNLPRRIRRATQPPVGTRVLIGLVVALLGGLVFGSPAAGQTGDGDVTIDPVELVPDVTLVAVGAGEGADRSEELAARLSAIDGVARAAVDTEAGDGSLIVHLALTESGGSRRPVTTVVDQATVVLEDVTTPVTITAGGAAIVDAALVDRFDAASAWLVVLAVLVGLGLGLVDGWRRSLASGAVLGVAVAAGAGIGAQVAGSFSGSMAETSLPAALGALVMGTVLVIRLVVWARRATEADGAATIQRAVADLGPELALLLAGLVATSLVVDVLDPGRSALTVTTTGAIVAAVVTLALLAPALTLLGPPPPRPDRPWLPLVLPDGRHLPLVVVALAALALAVVSIAAFGATDRDLLDLDQLDETSDEVDVATVQARRGGDPTRGMVVTAPSARPADLVGWVMAAAERPEVAWIDLDGRRFTATGVTERPPAALLSDPAAPGVAVVVPTASPRSVDGQDLAERLGLVPLAGGEPRFAGPAAVAGAQAGSRTTVVVAIVGLALSAGVGALVLTGNRALFAVSAGLRLLGGGATAGLHNLINPDPPMASTLTAVAVVGLGAWASELELLRRLVTEHESGDPEGRTGSYRCPVPGPMASNPGQFGGLGLAALVPAGLVLAATTSLTDAPGVLRLGLAIALAAMVEILIGSAVLRPALLGQRAAFQAAARPLRIVAHGRSTGDPEAESNPDDDPAWREVVIDLIETEFWLQTEPDRARLEAVFEADTPVHRQAAERHGNLVRSGFRVVGRNPELRSLRTVRERQPVILTVTVDHPPSQLLDGDGHVVGVRRPERRVGRLWLAPSSEGGHRIIESIELGSEPLDHPPAGEPEDDREVGNASPGAVRSL